MRSQADRNRREFSLPCFLEKPAAPPVDRPAPENMLDHAHVNTPVIQARDTVAKQLPSRNWSGNSFQWISGTLAGAGGFEPPNGGIKIHCLTTWRRPNCRKAAGLPLQTPFRQRRSIEGVKVFQQPGSRIRLEFDVRFRSSRGPPFH